MDFASLFIPVTPVTAENATQYAVLPPTVPLSLYQQATKDLDSIDLNSIVAAGHHVSVRQLLAPPFTVCKMQAGAIHRGIANRGDYDRVVMFIGVCARTTVPVAEPLVTIIPEELCMKPTMRMGASKPSMSMGGSTVASKTASAMAKAM